jgi:hypothetical protein
MPNTMSMIACSIKGCSSGMTLYTASHGESIASAKKFKIAGPLRSS